MRLFAPTLAFLALTTAALPYSAKQLPQLTLTGGESQVVPGTDVRLHLTAVTDQRCPGEVDCFWEGMIRVEISVMPATTRPQAVILCNRCDDGSRSAMVEGLELTLVGLSPAQEMLAELGRKARLSDYAVTLAYGPADR